MVKHVTYYLTNNPQAFTEEERNFYTRIRRFTYLTYFEVGLYVLFLFMGRPPKLTAGVRTIFPASKQKYTFFRILFLNLALSTNLVSFYRENTFKREIGRKYFS